METRNSSRKKWVQGGIPFAGQRTPNCGDQTEVCGVVCMYACLLPANYNAANGDVTETSTRASMAALRFSVKVWLAPDIVRYMAKIPADNCSLAAREGSRKRLTPDSSFLPKLSATEKRGRTRTGSSTLCTLGVREVGGSQARTGSRVST